MKRLLSLAIALLFLTCVMVNAQTFNVKYEQGSEKIEVFKSSLENPVITQNIKQSMRPYLHPVKCNL